MMLHNLFHRPLQFKDMRSLPARGGGHQCEEHRRSASRYVRLYIRSSAKHCPATDSPGEHGDALRDG